MYAIFTFTFLIDFPPLLRCLRELDYRQLHKVK